MNKIKGLFLFALIIGGLYVVGYHSHLVAIGTVALFAIGVIIVVVAGILKWLFGGPWND